MSKKPEWADEAEYRFVTPDGDVHCATRRQKDCRLTYTCSDTDWKVYKYHGVSCIPPFLMSHAEQLFFLAVMAEEFKLELSKMGADEILWRQRELALGRAVDSMHSDEEAYLKQIQEYRHKNHLPIRQELCTVGKHKG